MSTAECPVCLEEVGDFYVPPICRHPCCYSCLFRLRRNGSNNIICPMCRRSYDVPPCANRHLARYCFNLFCLPGSGCPKVHFDDLFPPSTADAPRPRVVAPRRAVEPEPSFRPNPDMRYCTDLLCPGGPEATCGKVHECDIFGSSSNLNVNK